MQTNNDEQIKQELSKITKVLEEINKEGIDPSLYTQILDEYTETKKTEIDTIISKLDNPLGKKKKTFKTIKQQAMLNGAILFQEVWEKDGLITKYGDIYISGYVNNSLLNVGQVNGSIQVIPFPSDVEFDMILGMNNTIYARPKTGQSDKGGITGSLDNYLFMLGENNTGQLGDGTVVNKKLPIYYKFEDRIKDIKLTVEFNINKMKAYILLNNKKLFACGAQLSGEFGIGNNVQINSWTEIQTDVEDFFPTVGSCFYYKTDKKVYASGKNNISGELGIGNNVDKNTLVQVKENVNKCNIKNGTFYISAYTSTTLFMFDNELYGAGTNTSYQITDKDLSNRNTITRVGDGNGADLVTPEGTQFFSNSYLTIIMIPNSDNYDVYMSGYARFGFGDGETTPINTHTKLKKIFTLDGLDWVLKTSITEAGLGNTEMIYFIDEKNKRIKAFGYNANGELGIGVYTNPMKQLSDVRLPLINDYFEAELCFYNNNFGSLVVIADNKLYVCGKNDYGRSIRPSSILTPQYIQ